MPLRHLTAKLAQQIDIRIDEELMGVVGAFSIDQLMELAGLACAQTLVKVYPRSTHSRVLVCCGPGNQGGDGLVAARHLSQFGYQPTLYIPKPRNKDIYKSLKTQCDNMFIPSLSPTINELTNALSSSDVILDAIFGFSFSPPVRPPFDTVLPLLAKSGKPIVSVDIPSGWDVEKGKIPFIAKQVEGTSNVKEEETTFEELDPEVLVSLTAPKLGAKEFKGRHFLGGRFVSKTIEQKYALNLPEYPGYEQIVEMTSGTAQKF